VRDQVVEAVLLAAFADLQFEQRLLGRLGTVLQGLDLRVLLPQTASISSLMAAIRVSPSGAAPDLLLLGGLERI